MAWFQVDDQLAMHRKVCEAGNPAMGLWVRAGAWSMANLTEGYVSKAAAKTLGTAAQAKALVTAGLWVEMEGGYQFHEWGTRQMSAEQVAERRRLRAEAGRKGGLSSKGGKPKAKPEADAQASAYQLLEQNGTPVPVPVLSGVTSGGNVTEPNAGASSNAPLQNPSSDEPPNPFCAKHPEGISDPCHHCRVAREQRKHWDDQAGQREADAKAARLAAIRDCPICDPNGLRNVDLDDPGSSLTRCDHIRENAHA